MRAVLMMLALAAIPVFAQGTPPAAPGFVANKESKVFHLPTCRLVAKIKPENKVWYANRDEAQKAGYAPCKVCLR